MKTKLLLCVLALVCFVSLSASPQTKTQQYEFKIIPLNCNEKVAGELSSQGWEVVSFSPVSYSNVASVMCVFKRPKT